MIGTFDKQTIEEHQDRFLKGKLATVDTPTRTNAMTIKAVDCAAQQADATSSKDKDFDDEILKEILAEQKEKEEAAKKEEKKEKKTKKGKGKKKKKKKSAKKDEL
jgi:hypothetical protein